MKKISLVMLVSVFVLSGCAPVIKGAAAVDSGVTNLRVDTDIGNKSMWRLRHNPQLQDTHVDVAVSHRNVLLAGQTPSPSQRIEAERVIAGVPGVNKIYNQIAIAGPTSNLTRSSDSWITTKVKSNMLVEQRLKSLQIKVVTENGVVYLMGTVTQDQANLATEVARQVNGVQKVVRLFDYV